ncbi:homocysteine S-methyltransferase family protein [Desulfocurvus sp.]|uniref:homocysteine S-methyltransferase family protein n=1 Tax=Desulfocurvus sp. TaxID=2871698 RepID=UPI0025BB9FAE|nr:homocysteine S-methyltransferase family protein [Desulfocurvus sp.]MCK9239925.1 homocysteine S-methyltransferase family protein [Desulfocurvus sp.]
MPDFRRLLADGRVHLFDGGMGTLLQARGLKSGQSPELFGLANPDAVQGVHGDYLAAGARVVTTNTFGGTAFKLGPGQDPVAVSRALAACARRAAGDHGFVAGSVGPTGHFVKPMGDLTLREMIAAFAAQIRGLAEGGADLVLVETQFDLAEARAAVIAARETCDLPVAVSMTFDKGACLTGTAPLTFIDTMQNMGVELLGTNCSAGPEQLVDVVRAMLPRLSTPLVVQPNAGLPELDDQGRTVFRLGPEDFAAQVMPFVDMGAKFLGGCCGTTPEHIRAVAVRLGERSWSLPEPPEPPALVVTSRFASVPVGHERPAVIIGERINPTGKKELTAQLQEGRFDEALRLAEEQVRDGARILDVNVGAPLVDEAALLPALVQALAARVQAPLCIDSTDINAVRAALDAYPGSPLVNSISGEPGRMEELGPLCRLYGAPFILLPLKGRKLPVTAGERLDVVAELLEQAEGLGIPRRLIVVDALVLTVSSKPRSALACFEVVRQCRERWGLATTCGLSNISFGLPARELLNSSFLTMGLAHGLTSFIANPGSARLRESLASAEVILARDPQAESYVAGFTNWTPGTGGTGAPGGPGGPGPAEPVKTLGDAVIRGAKDSIRAMLDAELAKGADPFALVGEQLIPAITEVGEKYERKEYFLPQLLQSAETMQTAFSHLRPLLEAAGGAPRAKIVMATVEGDIHDIGKNIVILMLRNNGFEVIDLGKDVPAERIVETAEREGASLIGLSALMTTTMVRMRDTVELVRRKALPCRVMVGGAVVTQDFADSIGADGYTPDAVSCVKLAKDLTA